MSEPPLDALHATGPEHLPSSIAEEGPLASATTAESDPPGRRPPGPGLPEALFWTVLVLGLQALSAVVVIFGLAAVQLASLGPDSAAGLLNELPQFLREHAAAVFGGSQLVFVLFTAAAVWIRLGMQVRRLLGLQALAGSHLMLLVGLVLPLAVFSGQVHVVATMGFDHLAQFIPPLRDVIVQPQSMEVIEELGEHMSLFWLLMAAAVAPALAEELVFRGVIGRGLLARWGTVHALGITTILFGVVHMHPAHAIAVLPLGLGMHVAYLATRSFWAPVLVHFLNNSLGVIGMKLPQAAEVAGDAAAADVEFCPVVFAIAGVCALLTGLRLWRSRLEYVRPDGTLWSPGYRTVEAPPEREFATPQLRIAGPALTAAMAVTYIAFLIAVGMSDLAAGG